MIPTFKFLVLDGLGDEFLPTKAEPNATGWDVRAAEYTCLFSYETKKISLGIRCFAPSGFWLELRPRSSTYAKKNLSSLYGVIDEGYENVLLFACKWIPNPDDGDKLIINKGDRIGQLVPVRRQEMIVEKVTESEFNELCASRGSLRGLGGFGSTDDK